jgi:RING finger/CCCH-type zinc finger protein
MCISLSSFPSVFFHIFNVDLFFKVSKREKDSSLMQLKPEYCTYIALRREHDAQIIKIAMEAGLRISPETWSTQLYGNTSKKSEMQSIIDKLVSQGVGSSGLSELIVAIGRSQDPYNLNERLISHLDNLLKLNITSERTTEEDDIITYENCSWETCSEGLDELFISLQVFIEFTQIQSGRYKTGMCPYLAKPTGCPRGTCCPYAHSEDERKKFVSLAKNNNNSSVTSNVTNKRIKSYQDLSQSISHVGTHRGDGGVTLGRYPSSNSIQHGGSPFSSLEEPFSSYSSGSNNVYPHDANPSFIIPTPPGATPIGLPGYYQQTNGTFPSPHYGPNPHQLTSELAYNGSYISPTVPPVGARRDVGGSDFMYRAATGPRTVKQRLPSIEATTSNASSSLQYDDVSSYPSTNSDLAVTLNSISSDDSSLTSSHFFEDKVKNVSIATTLSADALKYGNNSANTVAPCTSSNNTLMQSSSDDSFSGSEQDKLHYSVASSTSDKDSNVMIPRNDSNSPTIHELEAGIQALQMQLNKKREGNHSGELIYHHPLPVIYNTSPHNTGLIHPYSSPHHGGTLHQAPSIMPIHQPLPPHSFYNPMQSGIPTWNLPHPGPLHSTPPNSGLIMQAISGPPPHMGNPHHMMPHPPQPPPNIPPHHHKEPSFQIQSDNFLAHYIQFQEQSRAPIGVNYPIAPGAHLSSHAHPPPSHPHLPRPPYQHALYGIQQNVVARQY